MKEYLTGDDLYAYLLLLRTCDHRTIVVMEGPTDCAALDPHLDPAESQSIPGYGKQSVLRTIELVDETTMERVLGIIDRDWIGILDDEPESQNLILTDRYDLDATIFFTGDVVERVIANFCDRDKCEGFRTATGCSPQDAAIRIAGAVGVLRLMSDRDGLELRLRDFPIAAALVPTCEALDLPRVAMLAVVRADAPRATEEEVVRLLKSELASYTDLTDYCSGHDLIGALVTLAKAKLGAVGGVGADIFKSVVRASLSCEDLGATRLYTRVLEWAALNGTRVWSCA